MSIVDPTRIESFNEKLQRKVIAEPLVPLGALLTLGFLGSGLRAFHQGKAVKAQYLMRGRVIAQAFTVLAMSLGAFYGFKPSDRPSTMEEKLEREGIK